MVTEITVLDFIINTMREHEEKVDAIINKFEPIVEKLENERQLTLNLQYLFRDIPQMEAQ